MDNLREKDDAYEINYCPLDDLPLARGRVLDPLILTFAPSSETPHSDNDPLVNPEAEAGTMRSDIIALPARTICRCRRG